MANRVFTALAKFCLAGAALLASVAAYAAHDPIILIPGMGGVVQNMYTMRDNLVQNGWSSARIFPWTDADQMTTDMEASARAISAEVDQVLQQTGAKKVVLVTWSASTIAGRYYLKNLGGAAKVSQYISFAGPHHGISIWRNCSSYQKACLTQWGPNDPITPWLAALNSGTEVPGHPQVAYLTLRGSADVNATPVDTAILAGADENYLAYGLDHFSIITNAASLAEMRKFIIANETTGPAPTMMSCSGSGTSATSAAVNAVATEDTGPVVSYHVTLSGPTAVDDAAAGSGPTLSKSYNLANGYYTGVVKATNSLGNASRPCNIQEFLVGQPRYSQAVTDNATNHYLANRITVTQYNQLGAKYGYSTPFTLYNCSSTWTNDKNCGPMN
jgi:hypothetical protein